MTEVETATDFEWTSLELSTTRDSLHPYYHYECSVAAHTAAGTGPFSSANTVQTLPAGIYCVCRTLIMGLTSISINAAPTSAPTQVQVTSFDSVSISIAWEPPPFSDRNGDIVQYHIRVTELETQTDSEYTSTTQNYTLTSLHPYYSYSISIAAETIAVGPYSTGLLQQTSESGEFPAFFMIL